jgi:thioredoxin-dependent peroxiredoxin
MKRLLFLTSIILFTMNPLNAKGIEEGQPAPQLSAVNQDGETVNLGEAFSEGLTFVFFYPKADTSGCTAQACSIRDSYETLIDIGVKVYGISYDSVASQKAFKDKNHLPYDLISDQDKAVSTAFDRGSWAREAYLIQDGIVIWRDLNASTKTQSNDVLKALSTHGITSVAPE